MSHHSSCPPLCHSFEYFGDLSQTMSFHSVVSPGRNDIFSIVSSALPLGLDLFIANHLVIIMLLLLYVLCNTFTSNGQSQLALCSTGLSTLEATLCGSTDYTDGCRKVLIYLYQSRQVRSRLIPRLLTCLTGCGWVFYVIRFKQYVTSRIYRTVSYPTLSLKSVEPQKCRLLDLRGSPICAIYFLRLLHPLAMLRPSRSTHF